MYWLLCFTCNIFISDNNVTTEKALTPKCCQQCDRKGKLLIFEYYDNSWGKFQFWREGERLQSKDMFGIPVSLLLVYRDVCKTCLEPKGSVLGFAMCAFSHHFSSLSHCLQIYAGGSVVYTLAHAPKGSVIPYFFTPAFKALSVLLVPLHFPDFWLFWGSCAVEADCVLAQQYVGYSILALFCNIPRARWWYWSLSCLKGNCFKFSNFT